LASGFPDKFGPAGLQRETIQAFGNLWSQFGCGLAKAFAGLWKLGKYKRIHSGMKGKMHHSHSPTLN